jgi:sec-independent protein translocase protein TatA
MPSVGPLEIIVLLVVVLLIFGPKRLPDLGRSLGRGMREFKDSVTGKDEDEKPRIEQVHHVHTTETTPNVTTEAPAEEDPAPATGAAKPADVS